jgi:hypothetical protein
MKPKLVFSILRTGTNVLFYGLSVITIIAIVACFLTLAGVRDEVRTFSHDAVAVDKKYTKPVRQASIDGLIRYYNLPERYKIEAELNTPLGNFSFFNIVLNFGIGIVILGLFRKIFNEINLKNTFQRNIHRRLVLLAIIFVLADVINFINYFIFNNLIKNSPTAHEFQLVSEVGHGIFIGLIIYAIAIIYQRGLTIQEENELTV